MSRSVGVLLLLMMTSSTFCGCDAPRGAARAQPDIVADAKPQDVEPAPPDGAVGVVSERVERTLPAGAVVVELRHADAREVARMLNEIDEASFWAAESRRGCALRRPPAEVLAVRADGRELAFPPEEGWRAIPDDDPEVRRVLEDLELERLRDWLRDGPRPGPFEVAPPPASFRVWDEHALVVLEADRDDAFLARVRAFVERLDQPVPAQSTR